MLVVFFSEIGTFFILMVSHSSFQILADREYGVLDHQFRKLRETKMKMIYKTQLYRAKQLVLRVWSLPSYLDKDFWQ